MALSDQLKNWVIESERTCHIQDSVLGHLLWKATFILQWVNRLCIKEDRLCFLLTAQYEVLVSQQTTEVSCQWSLKLKVPISKYRTELFYQPHLREILFKCLQNSYWCMYVVWIMELARYLVQPNNSHFCVNTYLNTSQTDS